MKHKSIAAVLVATALTAMPTWAATTEVGEQGIVITSDDEANSLRIGGRLHLDTALYDSDVTQFDDTTDVRRARIYVSGQVFEDFRFKVDYDVGGTSTGWRNVWLSYTGFDPIRIKVGNFIPPFSMENRASSNNITFMERPLPNVLGPGFLLGAELSASGDHWTLAGGYFTEPLEDVSRGTNVDGDSIIARGTFAPIRERDQVLHFGAAVEIRQLDNNSSFSIGTHPESGLTSMHLIDTGTIAGAEDITTYGLEAAYVRGPFSLQGEYIMTSVQRSGGSDADFGGWYTQASYVLTGEHRRYSRRSGTFGEIRPGRDWGAVELAARYSTLDLTDQGITGGEETNVTVGANWYVGSNFRLMANHAWVQARPNQFGVKEDASIFSARAQIDF